MSRDILGRNVGERFFDSPASNDVSVAAKEINPPHRESQAETKVPIAVRTLHLHEFVSGRVVTCESL